MNTITIISRPDTAPRPLYHGVAFEDVVALSAAGGWCEFMRGTTPEGAWCAMWKDVGGQDVLVVHLEDKR